MAKDRGLLALQRYSQKYHLPLEGKGKAFRSFSGHCGLYRGRSIPEPELGSNALTFDPQDRLVINDHGNRRVVRLNESTFSRKPF